MGRASSFGQGHHLMNIDSRENKIQFIKNIFIHRKYVSSEELKSSYFQEYQTDDLYEFTSELTKLKFFEFDDSDFVKRQPSKLSSSRLGESDTIPRNSLIKYQDIKTGKYLTLHDARAIQSRRGQEKFRDDVLSRWPPWMVKFKRTLGAF